MLAMHMHLIPLFSLILHQANKKELNVKRNMT